MRKLHYHLLLLSGLFSIIAFSSFTNKNATASIIPQKCIISLSSDTTYSIAGLWTGTYSVKSASYIRAFSLCIYPDGTLFTKGDAGNGTFGYAAGTWSLTGKNFSATIVTFGSSVTQAITGTFSESGKLINVTWKDKYNSGDLQNLIKIY